MQNGLRQFADHPLVGEVRGVGLVAAIEVVEDKASKKAFAPARKIGPYIDNLAKENGMIIRAMGDSLGFTPPLIMKPTEINEMIEITGKVLDQAWTAIQRGLTNLPIIRGAYRYRRDRGRPGRPRHE